MTMPCKDCSYAPEGQYCDVPCRRPECDPCSYERYVASLKPGTWDYLEYLRSEADRMSSVALHAEEGLWDDWRSYVAEEQAAWREVHEEEERQGIEE